MQSTVSSAAHSHPATPRRRSLAWLKRGLFGLVIAVLTLGGIGAIYQAIATAIDRRNYPPPGQLVDVGGRRLHVVVTGKDTGQPAVILESGMATFSSNFFWVQSELATVTRVVAYDRAGLGWSDPAPEPHDAYHSARDLHAALAGAGVSPPYVVAGHSYGGLVARSFTDLYPDEVVGLVLVDASHPDQWAHIPASRDGKLNGRGNIFTAFLARLGVVRLFQMGRTVYAGLPERPAAEMRAIIAQPHSWSTSGNALLLWSERTRPQINQARNLGDLPLAVLSVTEQSLFADVLTTLQNELPALSSNSLHVTVQGATHESLVANRDHALVVVETIRRVLEAARTGRPLAAE
ncbi:MAG TPA: alpha/beta fold hydrolase [Anaerolineae bacterium]